jgi:hypothetical protein
MLCLVSILFYKVYYPQSMGRFVAIKDRIHAKKRLDSPEIATRKGGSYGLPVTSLDEGRSTRICDSNRCEANKCGVSVHRLGRSRSLQDALVRLTTNPRDACALVAVYDAFGNHLKASAVRWFGRNIELRNRAVLSILVAIGRQAGSYDPQSMNASEWVSRTADAEARRLYETLDADLNQRPYGGTNE